MVKYGREPAKQTDSGAEAATQPTVQEFLEKLQAEAQPGSYLQALEAQELIKGGPNYRWSELMSRAFSAEVMRCECGGRLRFIANITKPEAITAILRHLGLPETLPKVAPARPPPEREYGDELFDVV